MGNQKKGNGKSGIVRIVAVILAVLMLLGTISMVLSLLFSHSYALADDTREIRVGFSYGPESDQSYSVSAKGGFRVGFGTGSAFCSIWTTSAESIAFCQDKNLTYQNKQYVPSSSSVTVGGYHLEAASAFKDANALQTKITQVVNCLTTAGLTGKDYYAFGFYDGLYKLRIGSFTTAQKANDAIRNVSSAIGDTNLKVVKPDEAVLSLVNTASNRIAFEVKTDQKEAVLYPKTSGEQIGAMNGYTFKGCFVGKPNPYGISAGNVLDLETYINGVIPYEVGNTWPQEALKAFAICVRTVGLSCTKHQKDGFDICPYSCCQAYRGEKRVNDDVRAATKSTKGKVLTYQGKLCTIMYTGVVGNGTVDANDLYGYGDIPYLRAVKTPWEDYASHPMGVFANTVSAHDLYLYLKNTKGYTELTGDIKDVHIDKLGRDSSYVLQITVTDQAGHKVTTYGTYPVYGMLSQYCNSANFMVYHNGKTQGTTFSMSTQKVLTSAGTKERSFSDSTPVLTAQGIEYRDTSGSVLTATADGKQSVKISKMNADQICLDAIVAAKPDEFVFFGTGWGHGCGLSQWGAMNLAENGVTCEKILKTYFTGVSIQNYDQIS